MRNFTKCFAALALTMCMGGQAAAQVYKPVKRATTLEAGKQYLLYNATYDDTGAANDRNRARFYYDNGERFAARNTDPSQLKLSADDLNSYAYTLEQVGDAADNRWAIKTSAGKYVSIDGTTTSTSIGDDQTFAIEDFNTTTTTKGDVKVFPDLLAGQTAGDYTNSTNVWAIYAPNYTGNSVDNKGNKCNSFNGTINGFAQWSAAQPYAFYEFKETKAIITFQYKDVHGNTIATSTEVGLYTNDDYTVPAAPSIEHFTDGTPDQATITAPSGDITVTYTYQLDKTTLPFETSTVAEGATEWTGNEHWYTLYQRETYWVYKESANQIDLSASTKPYGNAALWCIAGDADNGYKIYNMAVGPTKSVFVADADDSKASLEETGASFTPWYYIASGSNPGGWCLYKIGDVDNVFLNKRENKLSTWVNAGAKGEVGSVVAFTAINIDEYETLRTNIQEGLDGVTGYTSADYNASGLADATTVDEFATALTKLAGKEIAVDANRYYRLTCESRNLTIGVVDDNGYKVRGEALNKAAIDQLWQVEATGNGSYRLKSANHGQYMSTTQASAYNDFDVTFTDQDNAGTYTMTTLTPGFVNLKGSGTTLHGASNGHLVSWSGARGTASSWKIVPAEDIEVALNAVESKSYATVHLPFGTKTTGDVKAYYATAKDDANVTMTETTDGIAANQGALLVSESGATTATLTIADGIEAPTDNLLKGTNVALSDITAADYYIFGNGDAGVGFYHPSATTLKANRAYIEAGTTAAASLKLNFGQTTGIESIVNPAADAAAAPLYDLQGRRVNNATKGIYIQGGKKVYVK